MKSIIILSAGLLISMTTIGQETKKDTINKLKEVEINTNKYKYKREKSTTVSRMPLNNIENPQVYNTVTSELLKEQSGN